MPEVLELLKREKEMKKQSIAIYMRTWIEKHRFDARDRSIGWALNRLEKECYVSRPRIGTWQITAKGLASTLTTEESLEIVERWTQREREAKNPMRPSKR
jgi:repressor of nif and glnA expression